MRTFRTLATTISSTTTRRIQAPPCDSSCPSASSSSPNTSRSKSTCLLLSPLRGTRPLRADMETLQWTSLSPQKCLTMSCCSITEIADCLTPWRAVPWKRSMPQDLRTLMAAGNFFLCLHICKICYSYLKKVDQIVLLKAHAGDMRTPIRSSDSKSKVSISP